MSHLWLPEKENKQTKGEEHEIEKRRAHDSLHCRYGEARGREREKNSRIGDGEKVGGSKNVPYRVRWGRGERDGDRYDPRRV